MKKGVCENCALCSVHYPSFAVVCDKDNHKILNETEENCEHFIELQMEDEQ